MRLGPKNDGKIMRRKTNNLGVVILGFPHFLLPAEKNQRALLNQKRQSESGEAIAGITSPQTVSTLVDASCCSNRTTRLL